MRTYVFDFDGTLVDSMPSFIAGVLKVLDEHSVKYNDDIIKIITVPIAMPILLNSLNKGYAFPPSLTFFIL